MKKILFFILFLVISIFIVSEFIGDNIIKGILEKNISSSIDRKTKINDLNINIAILKNEIVNQKKIINQTDIDKEELEFLRLNLLYSHKCQTRKLFSTGYKIGTPEYKECILNKGKIDD